MKIGKDYLATTWGNREWSTLVNSYCFENDQKLMALWHDALLKKEDARANLNEALNEIQGRRLSQISLLAHTAEHHPSKYMITKTADDIIANIKVDKFDARMFSKIKRRSGRIFSSWAKSGFIDYAIEDKSNMLVVLSVDVMQDEMRWVHICYDLSTGNLLHGEEEDYDQLDTIFKRAMLYIEFTDKEVEVIEPHSSNGKSRKDGKIQNESDSTLTVVDSKWNKITIRKEGWEVGGHFRLQPCGPRHEPRFKVIYIQPYLKHGMVRRR